MSYQKQGDENMLPRWKAQMAYRACARYCRKRQPTFSDYIEYRFHREGDLELALGRRADDMEKQYHLRSSKEAESWQKWLENIQLDWNLIQNCITLR